MKDIDKIAIIGCGSMGGGLALLFAESGLNVSLKNPDEDAMDGIVAKAKADGSGERVHKFTDDASLCASLGSPRVFLLSLPHGTLGDTILEGLEPYLSQGDIILDAANEHWQNTERRQGRAATRGVRYIGVGVSGGYQAARRGPSLCPGGDADSLRLVMPLLEKVAAKDRQGKPCVAPAGLGGSGHYVKMIHNGIEHGMMGAVAEAWKIMESGLGLSYDQIGHAFATWNESGELAGTFLIDIAADICHKTDGDGTHVLSTVEDKVVQDVTEEEGTGVWSNTEAIEQHVPAPSLSAAHFLRLVSADRDERARVREAFGGQFPPSPRPMKSDDAQAAIEDLRLAVYTASLASFAQGISAIDRANRKHGWDINYANVLQIWRAGCIIRADYIADLLAPVFASAKDRRSMNLLTEPHIATELQKCWPALKRVVSHAISTDFVIPTLSSTLEYLKYSGSLNLPTQFYEAQMDYFGSHMYDRKGEEDNGKPVTGRYHYEWKSA